MRNKCAKQRRPLHHGQPSTAGGLYQHTTVIRLYGLNYNNQAKYIVSVTSLARRPLLCIYHLLLGKTVLVSGLCRSSRATEPLKVKAIAL